MDHHHRGPQPRYRIVEQPDGRFSVTGAGRYASQSVMFDTRDQAEGWIAIYGNVRARGVASTPANH